MRVWKTVGLLVVGSCLFGGTTLAQPQANGGWTVQKFVDISQPIGIDFASDDTMYVGNDPEGGGPSEPARIRQITTAGVISEIGPLLEDPDKVLVDTQGDLTTAGHVLVGAGASLVSLNPTNGSTSTLFSGAPLNNIAEMTFDQQGRVIAGQINRDVLAFEGNTVSVVSPFTGLGPVAVAIDSDNRYFVGLRPSGEIYDLGIGGTDTPSLLATVAPELFTLAITDVGPHAGILFAGNYDGIQAIDPDTGAATTFATDFDWVGDIAFNSAGQMYIADPVLDSVYMVVPEPASLAVLTSVLVALFRREERPV